MEEIRASSDDPIDSRRDATLDAATWGRDLDVTIRIAPDGRVYFHDLPADMIEIARALCPNDAELARREAIARRMVDAERSVRSSNSAHRNPDVCP